MEVTLDYPLILIVHDAIKQNEDIVKVMDLSKNNKRSLLIFSMDLQEEPLSSMIYNSKKNVLGCCAVNVPYAVGYEEQSLEDIAVLTGATLVKNDGLKDNLRDIGMEYFGTASKVIIGQDQTQIIGGQGNAEAIEEYKKNLEYDIQQEPSKHFKKIKSDRLMRLNQIQATIMVGGSGDAEMGEERDLIVDSLNSARAALETGILPGGGAALFHASKLLEVYSDVDKEEENIGIKAFKEALQQPIRKIIGNSIGEDHVGYIIQQIEKEVSYMHGYNCRTEQIEDMYEAGVVDSYKVISSIIEDSTRLAIMIIMTE